MVLTACVVSVGSTSGAIAATPGQGYGYQSDIGTPDSGSDPGFRLYNPIAVSSDDGNVFITRSTSGTFDIVAPNGTSIAQPTTAHGNTNGLAVSPDGNTVFVSNQSALSLGSTFYPLAGQPVEKLVSDGAPTPTFTADPSWVPGVLTWRLAGLALDPSTGDVFAADQEATAAQIYRFDGTTGALVRTIDGSTTTQGKFLEPRSLATAPNGDLYVVDGNQPRVEHMGGDGSWKGQLKIPTGVQPAGIAVNPQTSDVAVEMTIGNDTVIRIYDAANTLKDVLRVPPAISAQNVGLTFSPDGSKLYVAADNGSAHVFQLGTRPGVDAPVVTQVTPDGARLTGAVATNGEPTTARVEYCPVSAGCEGVLRSDGPPSPWVALPDHPVSNPQDSVVEDLSGLPSNTRYLVRTYAVNDSTHVESFSASAPFSTALVPPTVQTGVANADATTADLTGTINTIGDQTTYHFEYGLTTNYGSRARAGPDAIAGNSRRPRTFTQKVKGLQPGTTYHYRLVATNGAGPAAGADRTFTTLGVDQVAPGRAYEQVTSPNKNGLSVLANWGFQAAADGSAIVYSAGSPAVDSESAAQVSRYLARREPSRWDGQKALDPPLGQVRSILHAVTQAVSTDLKHSLVVTSRALAPGAVEGAANIYVNDVDTGAYNFVGSATQPGAYAQIVGPTTANLFIGGADDFDWVVLTSRYPLLPGAPQRAMYKWSKADGLTLASVLPNGNAPTGNIWVQQSTRHTNPLASEDGNVMAFSLENGAPNQPGVYRREGGQTEAVSVSEVGGAPTGSNQPGRADGVSRDGRFVIFHSSVQLTDDATDPGVKMYRYDADGSPTKLTYLGPQDGTDDGALDVLGISRDGGTVYFNGGGQVLVWRDGQRDVVSPTALRANDYGFASPNGRYFAFAVKDFFSPDIAIHLYDAVAGEETCVSCPAGGGSPGVGRLGGVPDRTLSNRIPQVVTDDGHLYFDSTARLLSADRNGTSDVYEYYKGRMTLISPGDRDFIATLADITPDGSTVYFTTSEGLVGQDTDQSYDIYAARVGGGMPAQNPTPPDAPCAKAECVEPGPGPVASPPVGSPVQPRSQPSKKTNQAKVKLSLTRVGVGAKTMKITFHASQRGRVTVSGVRIVKAYKNVTKEGTYSVTVKLGKKARSLVHAKKKFKLAVKVTLAGGWGTASAKYSRTLNK